MLWVLLLAAVAIAALYYRLSRRRLYQLAKEIPSGMKEYPIVGHAYIFAGNSEDHMNSLQKMSRIANGQGGHLHIWMTNRLFIGLTDAKDIQAVSKACLDKDDFTMKFPRTVVGNGSIFAPVNIWHPRRKTISPFFKSNNLRRIMKVFDEHSTVMVDLMRSEAGGGNFSIFKYFSTYTFNSITESAMGIKMNSEETQNHFFLKAVEAVLEMTSSRMVKPWMHPDFIYNKLPVYKKFLQQMEQINAFVDEIIQRKRKEFAIDNTNSKEVDKDDLIPFLDMMIRSSGKVKSFTDLELREEIIVMAIAGNDTSAVSSAFTAVMLSRYPDVQDKVYKELKEVFGDSDRAVTSEDLLQLKYLEAVIKESLRLYPPVPIVVREVRNDVVLPSGTTLVDGCSVAFLIWGMHRNPAYWGADADQFRPERFLETPLLHPAQFIPFSYSVRNCIGGTYALMSMKSVLAKVLRRYRLLPPAGVGAAELQRPLPVKFNVTMKAVDNFILRIEERKKTI